jgi:low temperature requirement protein LtrA
VLGLIAIAVGDELAIAHPGDDATLGFRILAFGGPALFLFAQLLFHRAALGYASRSRAIGIVTLAVATAPFTLIVGIAAPSAVLIAVAITDTVAAGAPAPSRTA